jgi:hypothetical protein
VFSRNVDHVDGPSKGADVNKTCRLAMPNIVLLPCRTLSIEPQSWITVPQTETAHRFQSKPTMPREWQAKSMKSHWQHHKIVRTKDDRDEVYEEPEWERRPFPGITITI